MPPLSASGQRPKCSTVLINVAMTRQTPSGHCLMRFSDQPSPPGAFPVPLCQATLARRLPVIGWTGRVSCLVKLAALVALCSAGLQSGHQAASLLCNKAAFPAKMCPSGFVHSPNWIRLAGPFFMYLYRFRMEPSVSPCTQALQVAFLASQAACRNSSCTS